MHTSTFTNRCIFWENTRYSYQVHIGRLTPVEWNLETTALELHGNGLADRCHVYEYIVDELEGTISSSSSWQLRM